MMGRRRGPISTLLSLHPCWFLVSLPLLQPGLIIFWNRRGLLLGGQLLICLSVYFLICS